MRSGLYRWLYSLLLYLYIPLEILRLRKRAKKAPDYNKRWNERFATKLPDVRPGCIWFHTVSVGETLAAIPVIKSILALNPDRDILVTTMTPTGSERVRALLGEQVVHCYAPYDLPHTTAKFINAVRPSKLFIMETELWPNMLHWARKTNASIVLMNARMSEKSAKGYRRFAQLTKAMLADIDIIAVQNKTDSDRFKSLGASDQQLKITGNIKFDQPIPDDLESRLNELKNNFQAPYIWLAASTHIGEDEILIAAHQRLVEEIPTALLIIVPRHPERFNEVYELCSSSGLSVARRSNNEPASGSLYLADTMGELLLFCALADAVFVGGSLVNHGGHNCLEPAAFKKPIMSGVYDFNFAEINQQLESENALQRVNDSAEISSQLLQWYRQSELADQVGENAYQVVENNRGAMSKLIGLLEAL